MAGILSKSKAKGVDFCGGHYSHYIIRSDLGCYMYSSDFHGGKDLEIKSIHPNCQDGDHYFADTKLWYIIKGNSYRTVSDLSNDCGAHVSTLHPNCRGGDHYLFYGYNFIIIYQSRGVGRQTSNLSTDENGGEFNLHPNCSDGLYYWANSEGVFLVKPRSEWGVQFHRTDNLVSDTIYQKVNANSSFHPDVMNFLPGGLAVTHGPAFGRWDLIKTITNNTDSPITWEKKITQKVSYAKSKASSIEHNWKVSLAYTYQAGALTESIAKFQLSLTAEYGGKSVNTKDEVWHEETELEDTESMIVPANKKLFVWQYKLGLGNEDTLFCHETRYEYSPIPPSDVPLPPSNN